MSSDMGGYSTPYKPVIVSMRVSAGQAANIAAGDHFKFDVLSMNTGGDIIVPDVASAYQTAVGPSLGRAKLLPGFVYRICAYVPYVAYSASTGQLAFSVYDLTAQSDIGSRATMFPSTDTTQESGAQAVEVYFAPIQTALVELRITAAASLSQIGNTLYTPTLNIAVVK